MKKLLLLLFLSLGFFGNTYATVLICKDDNDLSTCSFPPPQKIEYLECKEGFVLSGNRCYKEGEEIPQEEIRPIEYHENGNKKSEALYKTNDGSLLKITMFYENGQKEMEYSYKDGKLTKWHEDGQIESESNWKDGKCISGDC